MIASLMEGHLNVSGVTDVGNVRKLNEDSFSIDPKTGLLIVADGMGGHDAGEVASKETIITVLDFVREALANEDDSKNAMTVNNDGSPDDDLTLEDIEIHSMSIVKHAVQNANNKISQMNRDKGYSEGSGMGTTVVGLWAQEDNETIVVFHVGDSRIYLSREEKLSQITMDHSMLQFWKDHGRVGKRPNGNILLKAIGPWPDITPDVAIHTLEEGDILCICSDGLTGMISDEVLEEQLAKADIENLEDTSNKLIALAKENGGKDNITVILAGYKK
jgi:PPM family protein phosphatase